MTTPIAISFQDTDLDALASAEGKLAVIVAPDGRLDPAGRRLNRLTRGALARLAGSKAFEKAETGGCTVLAFPAGLAAEVPGVEVLKMLFVLSYADLAAVAPAVAR